MPTSHDGHRERLRSKFLTSPASLEDHELLELLLFYVIPRCNTNELAHRLIDRFGSLHGVLDAGRPAITCVEDAGEKTALFLRIVSEVLSRYERSASDKPVLLDSYAEFGSYLKRLFVGTDNEIAFILLFDSSKKLILCKKISEGYSCGNYVSTREIAALAISNNAAGVVLAHNHPGGKAIPSSEDIISTRRLESMFNVMDIAFIDHFIVSGNDCTPILHSDKAHLFNMGNQPRERERQKELSAFAIRKK